MNFKDLKKNRSSATEQLQNKLEESGNKKRNQNDDRFYFPERDEKGLATVLLRFLPTQYESTGPYVKLYLHSFKSPVCRQWLIENCPTSLPGQTKCPVCEFNHQLWESGKEEDKQFVRGKSKRKEKFYTNVLVIDDPKNPENNGNVFMMRFGRGIFGFIEAALKPEFADSTPFNPFCVWTGADFRLRIGKNGDFVDYKKSSFEPCSELFGGKDKELEAVFKKTYELAEFVDPDKFNSFEHIENKLEAVFNESAKKTYNTGGGETIAARNAAATKSADEILGAVDNTPSQVAPTVEADQDTVDEFEQLAQDID